MSVPENKPVSVLRQELVAPAPEQTYKKVILHECHIYQGIRYLGGKFVVPSEMRIHKGEVLEENTKEPYVVPDQTPHLIETQKDFAATIAPPEKQAPIGGDTEDRNAGDEEETEEEEAERLAAEKAEQDKRNQKPSAKASS